MDAPRITVDALQAMLANAFEISKGYEPTPVSSVTFAGLNSYSRVPSPVVALLGFDGDAFPRSPNRRQFDGVALTRRVGDIDPADTDRARFLDAFMSAERHFIVLYSGRDIRTNAHRAPSVVIGEVMDAIDDAFEGREKSPGKRMSASESLTIEHPLQAFSPKNFQGEGDGVPRLAGDANGSNQFGPWSYDPLMLSEAQILADGSVHEKANSSGEDPKFVELAARLRLPAEQEREVVHLDELIRFFKDPAAEFLRRQLQMYLPRDDEGLRDRESIRLNSLEKYNLKAQFAQMYWGCEESSWDAVKKRHDTRRIQTMGTLPWGPAGTRAMGEQWDAVSRLFEGGLHKFTSAGASFDNAEFHREKLDLDVPPGAERAEVTKLTIVGDLGPTWGEHLVKVFPGNMSNKRTIDVWLNALFWSAIAERKQATVWSIYTKSKNDFNGEGFVFDEQSIEEFARPPGWTPQPNIQSWARSQFLDLLDLYLIGRERPLPLFLESSRALCWALRGYRHSYEEWSHSTLEKPARDAHNSGIQKVKAAWFGNGFDRYFDLSKPAVKVLYRDYLPIIKGEGRLIFEPQFYAYSRRLWRGAYEAIKATSGCAKMSSARKTKTQYKPNLSSITMGGTHA